MHFFNEHNGICQATVRMLNGIWASGFTRFSERYNEDNERNESIYCNRKCSYKSTTWNQYLKSLHSVHLEFKYDVELNWECLILNDTCSYTKYVVITSLILHMMLNQTGGLVL
jgi:hypothetical protein